MGMNLPGTITTPNQCDSPQVGGNFDVFNMKQFAYFSFIAHKLASMPKHDLLNSLPMNLAPFPQIHRNYSAESFVPECLQTNPHSQPYLPKSCIESIISAPTAYGRGVEVTTIPRNTFDLLPFPIPEDKGNEYKEIYLQKYRCRFCTRAFSSSSNLSAHIRLHTGLKPFKCRFCDKTSATASNILTHERVHTGVRPFKCDICGTEYSTSSNLKTHRRIHFALRPFVCRLCGSGFCTSSNLITHLRVHWGIRLYPCTTCGRQFSTSSNLHAHFKITHLGLKPFTCAICSKEFSTGNNLIAHCRSHSILKSCDIPMPSTIDFSKPVVTSINCISEKPPSTVVSAILLDSKFDNSDGELFSSKTDIELN